MTQFNSQEQTLYRSLANDIQLGFYPVGECLPSIQELATRYKVSKCPVQRAFKLLEQDGLIRLIRGKPTVVLRKPYENFLESDVFRRRIDAVSDLVQSLKLISPHICFQGLYAMKDKESILPEINKEPNPGKRLYWITNQALCALGNRMVRRFYYDTDVFAGSSFVDIFLERYGQEESESYFNHLSESWILSLQDCIDGNYHAGLSRLRGMEGMFYDILSQHLNKFQKDITNNSSEVFTWEPYKGRKKYCGLIAINLLHMIKQGRFPLGTLLPNNDTLASDVYHVSKITMRRTIDLLKELGVVEARIGVGTIVVSSGDISISQKIIDLMPDNNFRVLIEALQLLMITCEAIIPYTFPNCPPEVLDEIAKAVMIDEPYFSREMTISACLQAIVNHCPLATIREIYSKLILLLMTGRLIEFHEVGRKEVHDWPETSLILMESLKMRDNKRFASVFYRLIEDIFITRKQNISKFGISEVDQVVTPYFENISRQYNITPKPRAEKTVQGFTEQ